jgi:serine acetyltransferase
LGEKVYLGTNASIREGIHVCGDVTIGMNAAVVKNIYDAGVYAGVPAKKIR